MCATSHRRRPWQDLPPELLGLVLARLASHADRVRLPAVCRAWRSSARQQRRPLLPPPLPWLALPDGAFLISLPDGAIHRLHPSADFSLRLSTGDGGGKIFLHHRDGSCSLVVQGPSSSSPASDPLRDLLTPLTEYSLWNVLLKVVLLSDHLAAALLKWNRVVVVSTRRPPGALGTTAAATTTLDWAPPEDMFIDDIAVFKGEIYLLTADDELLLLVPGVDAEPQITTTTALAAVKTVHRIPRDVQRWHDPYATDKYVVRRYLVASGEQLPMVKRELNVPPFLPWGSGIHMRTCRFEVFEAAELLSGGGGRWRQVNTLTGRAIFVSQGCSESLPSSDQCGGGGGIRQDCIYFVTDDETHSFPEDPLFDSGVYDVRNRAVRPLPRPEMVVAPGARDDPWSPTWLFPET